MGILNLTADSFSDGGHFLGPDGLDLDAVLRRAEAMVDAGAGILDLGAESTRPGASPVPVALELDRIVAALEALAPRIDAVLSVDSSAPQVFTAAAAAGAGMLNDVRALSRDGALQAAAATGLPVCLMHMQGEPGTMQDDPRYGDVVAEVRAALSTRMEAARFAGIPRERILLDPGFGFGKTLAHNVELLAELGQIVELGPPVLVGMSRKGMIGRLTGRPLDGRVAGSVAAAALAVDRGARILRVHDVAETVDAVAVAAAVAGMAPVDDE
jgi:dihydropteroate synthase